MNGNAPSRAGTFQVTRGDGTFSRRGVGHFRKSDREVLPGPAFDCTQSSLGASGPAPGHRGAFKSQHDNQCSHRLVQRHVSPSPSFPFPHPPLPLSSCLDRYDASESFWDTISRDDQVSRKGGGRFYRHDKVKSNLCPPPLSLSLSCISISRGTPSSSDLAFPPSLP